ncbi:HNH endonuclease [Halalkalibaculum sp. DA384]|uniref:HNH endonuclease n=1 Tax=Halalkalibaculum sp. DA384 TaxID=3373606 RepID=UPI0037542471
MDLDKQIRLAAFNWLKKQVEKYGDVLNRDMLAQGFEFKGTRIPLVSPQGIFKPKILDLPLTITTSPKGPYEDSFDEHDFLLYKYRGTDPMHRDNVGLRKCMQKEVPLIYFHGIIPGKYLVVWPVYIIGDDPDSLTFRVAADNQYDVDQEISRVGETDKYRRAYITASVRQRLHQRGFRERVIAAYQSQCAFCHLKHVELLDAAHIIPDQEEEGIPSVNNGLALCKIHHAAFDKHILGVTPDYEIKVKDEVLREEDGPMLLHGIQELQDKKLILPRSKKAWPNQEFLEWRYQEFKDKI